MPRLDRGIFARCEYVDNCLAPNNPILFHGSVIEIKYDLVQKGYFGVSARTELLIWIPN